MNTEMKLRKLKEAAPMLADTSGDERNRALMAIAEAIYKNRERIFAANRADLENAEIDGVSAPVKGRLKFDDHKLEDVINGIKDLTGLPDPLFKVEMRRELDEDLVLVKETCPIGVIGVIFEARPDALVQISALCIKSGNCAVLKGGSEAALTNRTLFEVIEGAVLESGLPENILLQMEAREEISELLKYDEYVDLLIPRGSNAFVRYIMENSRIPVMGHSSGICHIYVDKDADVEKAIPIIVDAKTQYVSACNAAETVLIHRDILEKIVPPLGKALKEAGVELRASEMIRKLGEGEVMTEKDDSTEYLDYIISAREVEDIDEAIRHINHFGSHHTDAIITENSEAAARFMRLVDSAGVYQNCSTRFADGYRYGFGAEVGISTGKLHARGPVGLEGLISYKYKLFGAGQIVGDYASGRKSFNFKDLI